MNPCFTEQQRSELLVRYFSTLAKVRKLSSSELDDRQQEGNDVLRQVHAMEQALVDLRRTYREGLPVLPLSRCPISGQVMYHSFDPFGIDGLWWDYHAPARPPEHFPSTVVAMAGSLALGQPVRDVPFLCLPGPGIPFILPRLLKQEGVFAVLSTIRCGEHTGYPVMYFADPIPQGTPRVNMWGANRWEFVNDDGVLEWGESYTGTRDMDFNLEPWMEQKKLHWIREGDVTMTLHSGSSGCPYTGLLGERRIQRVQYGKVWFES